VGTVHNISRLQELIPNRSLYIQQIWTKQQYYCL